jgi:hypothetical protein
MAVAFVFPGQGSQAVGMGKTLAANFAAAQQVFEEVDVAIGSRLSNIIFEGPADALILTENAQPALMAVSLAALRVLEAEAGFVLTRDAQFVAGHSLGEYSALAAAGAFTVADAARLLRTRGQAMQKAVPVGMGAMASAHWSRIRCGVSGCSRSCKVKCVRLPTIMVPDRWLSLAIKRRSSVRWKSPGRKAQNVQCCCRYPLRFIVR